MTTSFSKCLSVLRRRSIIGAEVLLELDPDEIVVLSKKTMARYVLASSIGSI